MTPFYWVMTVICTIDTAANGHLDPYAKEGVAAMCTLLHGQVCNSKEVTEW